MAIVLRMEVWLGWRARQKHRDDAEGAVVPDGALRQRDTLNSRETIRFDAQDLFRVELRLPIGGVQIRLL